MKTIVTYNKEPYIINRHVELWIGMDTDSPDAKDKRDRGSRRSFTLDEAKLLRDQLDKILGDRP